MENGDNSEELPIDKRRRQRMNGEKTKHGWIQTWSPLVGKNPANLDASCHRNLVQFSIQSDTEKGMQYVSSIKDSEPSSLSCSEISFTCTWTNHPLKRHVECRKLHSLRRQSRSALPECYAGCCSFRRLGGLGNTVPSWPQAIFSSSPRLKRICTTRPASATLSRNLRTSLNSVGSNEEPG